MTKPRDPDMMAMDHAIKAMRTSTPRMLRANIAFVIFVLQRMADAKG